MVRILLEAGADKEAKGAKGATPLYMAASGGHQKVVGLLRKFGANMDSVSKILGTASQAAKIMRHEEVAEYIDKKRCHVCTKTQNVWLCSRCKNIYYCGAACQKADWKNHKAHCQSKDN